MFCLSDLYKNVLQAGWSAHAFLLTYLQSSFPSVITCSVSTKTNICWIYTTVQTSWATAHLFILCYYKLPTFRKVGSVSGKLSSNFCRQVSKSLKGHYNIQSSFDFGWLCSFYSADILGICFPHESVAAEFLVHFFGSAFSWAYLLDSHPTISSLHEQ